MREGRLDGPREARRACPLGAFSGLAAFAPPFGAVAQLGERRFCKPEVVGSIPISSMTRVSARDARCGPHGPQRGSRRRSGAGSVPAKRSLTIWTGKPSVESKRVVAHPGVASGHPSEGRPVANMVKLLRAHGECLGASRRRRTWLAAISSGEPLSRC